jgi:ribonuclease G
MSRELVISAAPHETRVAIVEEGQLCEIYIEREKEFALVGSIYKGRVTRVLPGMQSAFVDIGLDSDAFLYVGDFLENLEDYDHVVTTVEGKVEKMEQQGGAVFAPAASDTTEPPAESPHLAAAIAPAESGSQPDPDAQPAHDPRAMDISQPSPGYRGNQRPAPPFERRGHDRFGRGGGRGRGGRGRSGGRWQRGGRGGDRPHNNRELPPSKYASSRPFTPRPYEPPSDDLPADYEPVILPGESLAKYKNRPPVAPAEPAEPQQEPVTASADAEPQTPAPPVVAPDLPSSLFAEPQLEPNTAPPQAPSQIDTPPPATEWRWERPRRAPLVPSILNTEPARPAPREEPASFESSADDAAPSFPAREAGPAAAPPAPSDLTEDEMASLSDRLAEARHEEGTAQAASGAQIGDPEIDEVAAFDDDEDEDEEHEEESPRDPSEEADVAESEPSEIAAGAEPGEVDEAELAADAAALAAAGGFLDSEPAEPSAAAENGEQDRQPPRTARMSDSQRARFQRPMRRGGRHRGGHRPMRGGRSEHRGHQPQRRPPQLISEVLKAGQEILVQIAKEPLGKKGARITSHVALPGRYLVYMPTVNHIGVSRRIGSAEERSRLRRVVGESKASFPGGFIVRTAAEGAPEEDIRSDVEFLGRTWEKIRQQSEPRHAPALLHRDLNLVERILRDYLSDDYTAIWIDNEEEYGKVLEFVGRFQPKMVSRVKLYTKPAPIFEEFGIQQELDKALRPKVWLKSGGYIVINHTEALVAIDVNTGKYVGRGSTRLEDTIVKTNLEAVKEIVRQVRLRDLGGIIVLDFIDMEERRNRDKVMSALEQALRSDRAPSKVLSFNEFGLVAITRKRTKQALERVLCQPCPYCTGSGMVKSVPTICYEIQAEARKMAADLDASSLTLRVHPEIAKALKTRESSLIEELEQITRKSVIIQSDPTLHWEQYDIY